MKNWLRVTICVMLIVSVLAMSLSVFADDVVPTATPYPGTEDHPLMQNNFDDIAFVLWQLLESWGIKVTYGDITEYTSDIENQIQNWVWEFLDEQPSVETVASWVLDWWFGVDFWGNLVVNDTLLEDAQAFAQWLESKFGLTDNSIVVTDPIYSLNGYTIYEFDHYYRLYNFDGTVDDRFYSIHYENLNNAYPIGYIYATYEMGGQTYGDLIALFNYSETDDIYATWQKYNVENNMTANGSGGFGPIFGPSTHGIYWRHGGNMGQTLGGNNPHFSNFTSILTINEWMENANVVVDGDIKILTSQIIMPIEDPNYQSGDGMTIVDGQPDYSIINIPDTISVDNLPAVVSTHTIDNPHLEEAYRPIQGLITYAKDGVAVCSALLYELPDEIVYMWYGLIASIIIWGMIKLMREH